MNRTHSLSMAVDFIYMNIRAHRKQVSTHRINHLVCASLSSHFRRVSVRMSSKWPTHSMSYRFFTEIYMAWQSLSPSRLPSEAITHRVIVQKWCTRQTIFFCVYGCYFLCASLADAHMRDVNVKYDGILASYVSTALSKYISDSPFIVRYGVRWTRSEIEHATCVRLPVRAPQIIYAWILFRMDRPSWISIFEIIK